SAADAASHRVPGEGRTWTGHGSGEERRPIRSGGLCADLPRAASLHGRRFHASVLGGSGPGGSTWVDYSFPSGPERRIQSPGVAPITPLGTGPFWSGARAILGTSGATGEVFASGSDRRRAGEVVALR